MAAGSLTQAMLKFISSEYRLISAGPVGTKVLTREGRLQSGRKRAVLITVTPGGAGERLLAKVNHVVDVPGARAASTRSGPVARVRYVRSVSSLGAQGGAGLDRAHWLPVREARGRQRAEVLVRGGISDPRQCRGPAGG